MPDINFLANKNNGSQNPKKKDDQVEKIIWSELDKNKTVAKETPFSLLAFLNKQKKVERPVLAQKAVVDKNKIQESRREILKLIKHNESLKPQQKQPSGGNFWNNLLEKFKKQPSHKENLLEHQQFLNQEKAIRNLPVNLLVEQAKPTASRFQDEVKKPSPAQPAVKQAPVVATPAPKLKNSFFKDFKNKIASFNFFKARSIKSGLASAKDFKLKIVEAKPELSPRRGNLAPAPAPKPVSSASVDVPKPLVRAAETEKKEIVVETEPSEVLKTNLIKGEIINFFDWQRKIVILISVILVPIFIVTIIYFGLIYYQKQNQAENQEQAKKFDKLTEEIKQAEAGLKEATEFQSRLKTVAQIFAKHIYWTNFFKFLEDNTINDVYYRGFNGDTSGDYTFDAVGLKFSSIAEQVDILKQSNKITDVKIDGGEAVSSDEVQSSEVKFNLSFSILKNIFTE